MNFNDGDNIHIKDRGRCIGYIGEECINCKRVRVEKWENGEKICEKCGINQDTKEYERDYLF